MSNLTEYTEKLRSADEAERLYAAEDIGYLNSPDGVAPLVARVGEEASQSVRDAIFQALIRMDGDAPIGGAVTLLASDSPQIRNQAVDILRRKGEKAIPFLRPVMRDGDKDMRKLVLDVLSGIPGDGARDIYDAALCDADPNVMITAVENLGQIRGQEFRAQIETLLEIEMHPMLTAACLEALAGIGNPASLRSIRRRFPDLSKLPDYFLVPCLRVIGAVGGEAEFVEAGGLLAACRPNLQPGFLGAMLAISRRERPKTLGEELERALQEVVRSGGTPFCRYQAVQLLGLWREQEGVEAFLIGALENPEPLVRMGAAESLRRPGEERLEVPDEEDTRAPCC